MSKDKTKKKVETRLAMIEKEMEAMETTHLYYLSNHWKALAATRKELKEILKGK